MVPASSHKVPRVSWYSGYRLADSLFAYGAFTLSGWLSQNHSAKLVRSIPRSEPQGARTLVWALSISLAATLEIDVSFSSSGYLDVSVHRVPFHTLWIGVWMTEVVSAGFPHSDISGSLDICSSPKLFAAYHVFHRLLVPRHPPCALLCLTAAIYSVTWRSRVTTFVAFLSSYKQGSLPVYPRMSCDGLISQSIGYFFSLYAVFKVRPRFFLTGVDNAES